MKSKKFLSLFLLIALCLALFSGCSLGSYLENNTKKPNGGTDTPVDPEKPGGPDDPVPGTDTHYTVAVYYDNRPFEPGDLDITVVWRSATGVTRQLLDSKGEADAGELDGDYNVYLSGLPDQYTYDPNGYKATSDHRKVTVLLTDLREPASGNGSNIYANLGCYQMRYEGTYRSVVKEEGAVLYYEFQPRGSGVFTVESWVNIYDDEINPYLDLYAGSSAFKWANGKLDGGGATTEGGFTKNFRWEIAIGEAEIGGVYTFAVGAKTKSGEYPVSVDFCIRRIGDYTSDYLDIRPQTAKEAKGKTPEPAAGTTFTTADLGTMTFNANNYKKSPNTGRYHLYDTEAYGDNPFGYGKGYGPMLMCAITKAMPAYTVVESLYAANSVGPSGSNYLMLYNTWIEEEQKFATFDYTNFIRVDYFRVCNSDGVCYVTDELIAFLQKFAQNHSLYTDGIVPYDPDFGVNLTPEQMGYTANQDSLWLFACGVYL